ncbi:MAG TPA: cyclopropane-fatty-acyl-phospholipid synthase family protein [Candidatus Acidoferrales bacterium]|nr:cyclopropane-fatty-acyl-phospholipid synthase family protein [Candidatus Acidoferrales bacterium]
MTLDPMAATPESATAQEATPELALPAWYAPLVESGLLPDALLRWGIRGICASRLRDESAGGPEAQRARRRELVAQLGAGPIAVRTQAANTQHYEVPAEFFQHVLGRHMKYSCGYWPADVNTLDAGEEAMLALTAARVRIAAGQRVLELGCGWGSLTLYLAGRFPDCSITAVSNSRSQKDFIDAQARARGIHNVQVITADMNEFDPGARFDRIVSVEMFEHMRNYRELFARIARWMQPDALLFVHVFAHAHFAYPYEDRGPNDWMARHFFAGGMMPSEDLLPSFDRDVRCLERWRLDGTHYQRTANAWLARMDANSGRLLPVLAATYGRRHAQKWRQRWRLFFMACAELWGYRGGSEWIVCHYLFGKQAEKTS